MGERKADFAGYIIGSDREEFLASVTGDPDYIGSLSWARLPGLAQVFQTHADALAVVRAWQRPDGTCQPFPNRSADFSMSQPRVARG
jgi:hypothetical protein